MAAVFFLNLCVNALLLAGTDKLLFHDSPLWRRLFAAALGAAHAVLCLLPGFAFLGGLWWRILFLCLVSVMSFGMEKDTIRLGALFVLLNLALGGAAHAAGQGNGWPVLVWAAAIRILSQCAFTDPVRKILPAELRLGEKCVTLKALADTGNTLQDPVTGKPVMVIARQPAIELTGLTPHQLNHPLETMSSAPRPGLRLIPYHSVGTETGLLLAMRLDEVRIAGKKQSPIVAFAPTSLEGKDYQALTHWSR